MASIWPFCIKLELEQVDTVQKTYMLMRHAAMYWHGLGGPLNLVPTPSV